MPIRTALNTHQLVEMVSTQERFDRTMKELIDKMERDGAPDEAIAEMWLQWQGGACPVCNKAYEKRHSKNSTSPEKDRDENVIRGPVVLSDFTWYEASCSCVQDAEKNRRRVEEHAKRLKAVGIPEDMSEVTFDNWEYSVGDETNDVMKRCVQLLESDEFFTGMGAVLMGSPGRGKTHLGVSMIRWLLQRTSLECTFEKTANIVGKMIRTKGDTDYVEMLLAYDVIMLDDIDKLYTANDWIKERVFSLIDGIMSEKKYLIATTNLKTMVDFEEKFEGPVVSRLMGGAQFLKFPDGEDYRKIRRLREVNAHNAASGENL
jgi:DNA replication protein DnaC